LSAEVSQPTEVEWNFAYPVEVLLACFVENLKELTWRGLGFDVGVDAGGRQSPQ